MKAAISHHSVRGPSPIDDPSLYPHARHLNPSNWYFSIRPRRLVRPRTWALPPPFTARPQADSTCPSLRFAGRVQANLSGYVPPGPWRMLNLCNHLDQSGRAGDERDRASPKLTCLNQLQQSHCLSSTLAWVTKRDTTTTISKLMQHPSWARNGQANRGRPKSHPIGRVSVTASHTSSRRKLTE